MEADLGDMMLIPPRKPERFAVPASHDPPAVRHVERHDCGRPRSSGQYITRRGRCGQRSTRDRERCRGDHQASYDSHIPTLRAKPLARCIAAKQTPNVSARIRRASTTNRFRLTSSFGNGRRSRIAGCFVRRNPRAVPLVSAKVSDAHRALSLLLTQILRVDPRPPHFTRTHSATTNGAL